MKNLSTALTAVLVLAAPLAGMAQNTHKLQPNEHTLNLPGATTIDAPPAGFDPITASEQDLAYHGFPPRPDQNATPKAYATWVKAMNASKTRVVPKLEQTEIYHGPVKPAKLANPMSVEFAPGLASQPSNTAYSYNWSGYVDFSGATSYGSSSYYFLVNHSLFRWRSRRSMLAPAAGTTARHGMASTAGVPVTCCRPASSSTRSASWAA